MSTTSDQAKSDSASASTPATPRATRQKRTKATSQNGGITLPIEIAVPVGLAAYMSQFTGKVSTVEEIVVDAVIRHLEYLQKHGPVKLELPPTMLATLTAFKQKLLAPPTPD